MKKVITSIILLIISLMPVCALAENQNARVVNEPVKVYLFRGEGCPHCEEFMTFINSLDEEYKSYFTLEDYEVWNDASNSSLMNKAAKALNTTSDGVPFIIIGDKYFSGYQNTMDEEIKSAIVDLYNSEERYDVMEHLDSKPTKDVSPVAIGAIILIVIGGFAGLGYAIIKSSK